VGESLFKHLGFEICFPGHWIHKHNLLYNDIRVIIVECIWGFRRHFYKEVKTVQADITDFHAQRLPCTHNV